MKSGDFDDSYFVARLSSEASRMKMHELDRRWMLRQIDSIERKDNKSPRVLLDIGCADGRFLKGFNLDGGIWGIEPNARQKKLAKANGLQITNSISKVPNLDSVILRGVLHHLPNYTETFGQILEALVQSKSVNKKLLFLLANPNAESFFYQKFGRLPALEFGTRFESVYKVHCANEVLRELNLLGFKGRIRYPYLRTPYSSPLKDLRTFTQSIVVGEYIPTPFPRNMFNLVAWLDN
jgi:hypothetical protein